MLEGRVTRCTISETEKNLESVIHMTNLSWNDTSWLILPFGIAVEDFVQDGADIDLKACSLNKLCSNTAS